MQFGPAVIELPQDGFNAILDGRMIGSVSSDKFPYDGSKGGRRKFSVRNAHLASVPHAREMQISDQCEFFEFIFEIVDRYSSTVAASETTEASRGSAAPARRIPRCRQRRLV